MIYHLVSESEFRACLEAHFYNPKSLSQCGFVHCALRPSVIPVASDYFSEVAERVLLLEIDCEHLEAEVRLEAPAPMEGAASSHLDSAEEFPHVYGPINTQAISGVGVLRKDSSGFRWPEAFVSLSSFYQAER